MSQPISAAQQERFNCLIDAMLAVNVPRITSLLSRDTPLVFRGVLTSTSKDHRYQRLNVLSCNWRPHISALIIEQFLEMNDADFRVIRASQGLHLFQKVVYLPEYRDIMTKLIIRLGFVPEKMILPVDLAVAVIQAGIHHPATNEFAAKIVKLEACNKSLSEVAVEAVNFSKDLIRKVADLEEQLAAKNREQLEIKESFNWERWNLQKEIKMQDDSLNRAECRVRIAHRTYYR